VGFVIKENLIKFTVNQFPDYRLNVKDAIMEKFENGKMFVVLMIFKLPFRKARPSDKFQAQFYGGLLLYTLIMFIKFKSVIF